MSISVLRYALLYIQILRYVFGGSIYLAWLRNQVGVRDPLLVSDRYFPLNLLANVGRAYVVGRLALVLNYACYGLDQHLRLALPCARCLRTEVL